jgi:hypothetical protein
MELVVFAKSFDPLCKFFLKRFQLVKILSISLVDIFAYKQDRNVEG